MITTYKSKYDEGELRIGWASWDEGRYEDRSIKYAYRDTSGKISRGSPELSFAVLVDMIILASDQGELKEVMPKAVPHNARDVSQVSPIELKNEKKTLSVALVRIQELMHEIPWANWQPLYDQIGTRLDEIKKELAQR